MGRCFLACVLLGMALAASAQTPSPTLNLRVVGGLGSLNQYNRHEAPFWTRRLAELSAGRYNAEIVPFDRAGIRGAELLAMVRLGTVPFGTLLLSQASPRDAELAAADLAGLNPDMATLRQVVAAWRPRLQTLLRERHGAELLAVYAYPAQVLFCKKPFASLGGLRGLRVRTSSPTQADFVEALGAQPVTLPFAELVANVRAGNVDCAVTGTMSGNTIGLHDITTHLHAMPVSWGLSMFVAHGATWRALPADLRELLQRELPTLEARIWDEAARETDEGVACNSGSRECRTGKPGRMTVVRSVAADEAVRRELLERTVLPRWLQRCGAECAATWNRHLAPVVGLKATAP
jgi:TRAP-type C4-dicarboxylate transport system substrate-binding protein